MKKTWKKRRNEAVSPVIATILMVAITVVLAAVLYVMVINIKPPDPSSTPIGFVQQNKDTTSVSLLIASAPTSAQVGGTDISISQHGTPKPVNNVTVYTSSALTAAWYDPAIGWTYGTGFGPDDCDLSEGMIVVVYATDLSSGDVLTFSNTGYYQTTTFNVS